MINKEQIKNVAKKYAVAELIYGASIAIAHLSTLIIGKSMEKSLNKCNRKIDEKFLSDEDVKFEQGIPVYSISYLDELSEKNKRKDELKDELKSRYENVYIGLYFAIYTFCGLVSGLVIRKKVLKK